MDLPDIYHPESFIGEEYEETFSEVWDNCVIESVLGVFHSLYKALLVNIFIGIVTAFEVHEWLFHCLTALGGIFILLTTIQSVIGLLVVLGIFFSSYLLIIIERSRMYKRYLHTSSIQAALITLLVLFEYLILQNDTWLEIRGIMMVFSMKLISIISDQKLPKNILEYFGYVFCSANLLFGPWISFNHYLLLAKHPTKKNIYWIFAIVKTLILAIVFLTTSNCWANYFIPEDSNSLLNAYREALSFRTSHYFVCMLSETFMIASGWKTFQTHFDNTHWSFPITDVLSVELPTSLAHVVVNWNKPMHEFLKKYVYKKWISAGKFQAIFITFVISALFHGLELKVSTVLISLGIFSYLQVLVRDHLSHAFDICVKVRPCKICEHKITRDHIICKLSLVVLSLFTLLHLIFLGVVMDHATDVVGIYRKWRDLYFYSLWIMFINFLIAK